MPKTMKWTHNGKKRTFALDAPAAKSVQLVGDFTDWSGRPIELHKGANGVWERTVRLEPGTHRYRFLVDGDWRDDPACPIRVPNPFGSEDMVCQVA